MTTVRFYSLARIATAAGITAESARTYHKRAERNRRGGNPRPGDLPPPDHRIDGKPIWAEQTIAAWLTDRPRAAAPTNQQGATK